MNWKMNLRKKGLNMSIPVEFDPYNASHIKAYKTLCDTGCWPKGVTFAEVAETPQWPMVIMQKLALAWVNIFPTECE